MGEVGSEDGDVVTSEDGIIGNNEVHIEKTRVHVKQAVKPKATLKLAASSSSSADQHLIDKLQLALNKRYSLLFIIKFINNHNNHNNHNHNHNHNNNHNQIGSLRLSLMIRNWSSSSTHS